MTWNLNVVTHEIGHNIGANHTHWCGWLPDPTLDSLEVVLMIVVLFLEVLQHVTHLRHNYGTIMSYCHVGGGGIQINFHEK